MIPLRVSDGTLHSDQVVQVYWNAQGELPSYAPRPVVLESNAEGAEQRFEFVDEEAFEQAENYAFWPQSAGEPDFRLMQHCEII